jgi:hypothetical protein
VLYSRWIFKPCAFVYFPECHIFKTNRITCGIGACLRVGKYMTAYSAKIGKRLGQGKPLSRAASFGPTFGASASFRESTTLMIPLINTRMHPTYLTGGGSCHRGVPPWVYLPPPLYRGLQGLIPSLLVSSKAGSYDLLASQSLWCPPSTKEWPQITL